MALNEWSILLIYVGAVTLLRSLIAYYVRRKLDANNNGTIDPGEVEFLNNTQHMTVVLEQPGFYDLSIQSHIRTFVEAMLHAFCYGSLVVFSMNFCMIKLDKRYAYLLAIFMIEMACVFMCHFSTNGIHVVTSHTLHLLYYGFGFSPLAFLWIKPENKYLIPITAIATLLINRACREVMLPKYPTAEKLTRKFQLDHSTGRWKLASVPSTRFGANTVPDLPSRNLTGESEPFPGERRSENMLYWATAFPTYEILNTHISSSFSIGILVAVVTSNIIGAFGLAGAEVVSNKSLAISVFVSAIVTMISQSIFYCPAENKMHKLVLAKFWPKTVAVLLTTLGAAAVVIQLDSSADAAIVYWVGVGALIPAIFITFVQSFMARPHPRNDEAAAEETTTPPPTTTPSIDVAEE